MVSEKLKSVILEELELDDFDIVDTTTADKVPGWDSLRHVRVILAVEQAYGVRFRTLEVIRLKKVGDLQALIDRKIGEPPKPV
jgi:acyl carrier protein